MRSSRPGLRLLLAALGLCAWLGPSPNATAAPRTTNGQPIGIPNVISRTTVTPTSEELVVEGAGRPIRSVVLLPDGYRPGRPHRVLMAVHNFAGDAEGFGKLIHAERLRRLGLVVVLPEAAGLVREWHGPGLTITVPARGAGGRIDDVAGLLKVLAAALTLYGRPGESVDLLGFSQGATMALALARRLDLGRAGSVRNLVMAAGSVSDGRDASLALPGTDVLLYDPGRNGPQHVANLVTGEPDATVFIPWIVAEKGCRPILARDDDGLSQRLYRCRDGRRLLHIHEAKGEHAWPGQDRQYDSLLLGRGSLSRIDLTDVVGGLLTGRARRARP